MLAYLTIAVFLTSTPTSALELLIGYCCWSYSSHRDLKRQPLDYWPFEVMERGCTEATSGGWEWLVLHIAKNIMPKTFDFKRSSRVSIETRDEWQVRWTLSYNIYGNVWFTDGLDIEGKAESGVYGSKPWILLSSSLKRLFTIFEAEALRLTGHDKLKNQLVQMEIPLKWQYKLQNLQTV